MRNPAYTEVVYMPINKIKVKNKRVYLNLKKIDYLCAKSKKYQSKMDGDPAIRKLVKIILI